MLTGIWFFEGMICFYWIEYYYKYFENGLTFFQSDLNQIEWLWDHADSGDRFFWEGATSSEQTIGGLCGFEDVEKGGDFASETSWSHHIRKHNSVKHKPSIFGKEYCDWIRSECWVLPKMNDICISS